MNEWCIYIALYCVLPYTQSALQSRGGGGGGLSTTTSAVHVDNVIFNQSNASLQNISILVTLNHYLTDTKLSNRS